MCIFFNQRKSVQYLVSNSWKLNILNLVYVHKWFIEVYERNSQNLRAIFNPGKCYNVLYTLPSTSLVYGNCV